VSATGSSNRFDVCNNTFYSCKNGINTTSNSWVYNNILHGNFISGSYGMRDIGEEEYATQVNNNCVYGYSTISQFTSFPIPNNITTDPLFIDTIDFKLDPSSPCLDAGANQSVDPYIPSTDFYGTARPQSTNWDIGAYEYLIIPPPSVINSFDVPSVAVNVPVVSTIHTSVLVEKIQAAVADPYFDSTSEVNSVIITYTHSEGRQKKVIVHSGVGLTGQVAWGTTARDGTWEKTNVKAFDADGAMRSLTRVNIGSGEDLTKSDGTIYLNT
jgi:hypothetical protein